MSTHPTGPTRIVTRRQVRTGLWTALSVGLTIIGVLLLSTIDNPDGTPWLENNLVGQTLTIIGAVAAVILPSLVGTRKDAAVARDQLENSHVDDPMRISNVRDDMDRKHEELLHVLRSVQEEAGRFRNHVEDAFNHVRMDIGGLRGDLRHERKRIDDLERTEEVERTEPYQRGSD